MAGLEPRLARCRSRQFADRFSSPSSNHFTQGTSPVRTLVKGLVQASSALAVSPQKPLGSSTERRYIRSYSALSRRRAFAVDSAGGGKVRLSREIDSMAPVSVPLSFASLMSFSSPRRGTGRCLALAASQPRRPRRGPPGVLYARMPGTTQVGGDLLRRPPRPSRRTGCAPNRRGPASWPRPGWCSGTPRPGRGLGRRRAGGRALSWLDAHLGGSIAVSGHQREGAHRPGPPVGRRREQLQAEPIDGRGQQPLALRGDIEAAGAPTLPRRDLGGGV